MNIALVTYQDKGAYASPTAENEDDSLLKFLQSKNLKIEKVIWNDPQVIWENYDLAILKSPWDYFDLVADFYNWLANLEGKNIRLLNPIDIVKWNADKHYLHDIEKAGLKVTQSIFIDKGQKINLQDYFEELRSDKIIVKPAVSGGSKNTFKVTTSTAEEISTKLNELLQEEDFILQPFLTEIEQAGEWSFLFFGGKFSHALLKKAKSGDFRVQHSFGGTIHPQQPPKHLLTTAQQYIDQFAKNCLYARVDGAVVNGEFLLMELELIEPFLFLATEEKAFENYYEALMKLV
ncbi:RimK family alpha-L-glutamate ligase [Pedobacter sp. UC225_61]|uniref:RimK family alpha-L-glutamate ligase n=1 Tax=Pedobacter sp. UC225_61 TaxID=3374623 RepID=UPI0037B80EC5